MSARHPDSSYKSTKHRSANGYRPSTEAKIVMCSAMGQEAMVVEAIKLGALDFIVKPFKPDRILATVTKILG